MHISALRFSHINEAVNHRVLINMLSANLYLAVYKSSSVRLGNEFYIYNHYFISYL